MPDFEYKLKNGRTLVLKGDTQPDDSEVEAAAKEQGVELLPVGETISEPTTRIEPQKLDIPEVEEEPSILSRAYETLFNAPKFVTEPAARFAETITEPSLSEWSFPRLRGFAAGATEGAASLLSPANILTLGRGRLPQLAARIAGGVSGLHGAEELVSGDTSEGIGDIAMGILLGTAPGLARKPSVKPPSRRVAIPETITDITPELPPEMVPPGAEDIFNAPRVSQTPARTREEIIYENAKRRFGMGQTLPEFDPASLEGLKPTETPPSIFGDISQGDYVTPIKGMTREQARFNKFLTAAVDFPEEVFTELSSLAKEYRKHPPSSKEAAKIGKKMIIIKDFMEAASTSKKPRYRANIDGTFTKVEAGEITTQFGRPAVQKLDYGETPKGGKPPAKAPEIEVQSSNAEPIIRKLNVPEPEQASAIREAWNLSRGLMAVDLPFITSAGFRQGLPLIGTKNWIKAWAPSIKSYGSKAAFNAHRSLIDADPLVKARLVPVLRKDGMRLFKDGRPVMEETPSILSEAGIDLTDVGSLSSREESIRSQLAERIPVWGKVVAASNRSYVAYINDLRLNTFRNLYEAMPNKNDIVALKQLGDYVNTVTGRGPLRTKLPFREKEFSLEKYAQQMSEVLFAPKLIASRMQMVNPMNYITTAPQVRNEYLKSLLRTAGAWTTMAGMAKFAGAEVSLNPTSADFGKIKIGDLRLDPAGGFQQYLVLLARLAQGETTSSTTGKTKQFGEGFKPATIGSTLLDFTVNKLHPSLKYFWDAAFAQPARLFGVFDRAVEMAIPMITSDLIEVAKEEPELLPWLAPLVSGGMGAQFYERGSFSQPKFIPEEYDITLGAR